LGVDSIRLKPFALLQQDGMHTVRISEIKRQKKPELKTAVELAAEARTARSLQHIAHVQELKLPAERHRTIVAEYVKLSTAERGGTLIVAGTNKARRDLNQMVRQSLELTGKGRVFDTLVRVDMTQAQRRFAPSYQVGMVVQPEKDYARAGLARGETYHVKEALSGNVLVLQRPDGTTTTINPRKVTLLSVYGLERAELTVGDTIRINRNDARLDLTSGDRMRIAGVTGGVVKLESVEHGDGRAIRTVELLSGKPLHLEHAYASTVHSSQGLTSDRALIALDTRSRTTSMNLYYVAISRARHEVRIYTNSTKELPAAIGRRFDKTTALEIQRQRQAARVGSPMQDALPLGTGELQRAMTIAGKAGLQRNAEDPARHTKSGHAARHLGGNGKPSPARLEGSSGPVDGLRGGAKDRDRKLQVLEKNELKVPPSGLKQKGGGRFD
jgi:hypothetical protein